MSSIFSIFIKEIKDALRDRRTLLVALLSSLLSVPLMLIVISTVLSQVESQEEKRQVLAVGIQHAPVLENFILRQGYQVVAAPADYAAKSRSKELTLPILIIPSDFNEKFSKAEPVTLEIAYDTSNKAAEFGLRPLRRLLDGFAQETVAMELTMRGISMELLQRVEVREHHLQKPDERKSAVTAMLPMMVLMAIILGGMYAAIDTTAGERERGSLEPLMMNPVSGWQLALGKWGAVTLLCMGVVLLTIFSFFPSQWLIQNDSLRAEFQFGLKDAWGFALLLLPLAACIAALQVAISLDCKSYKEAQARNSILSIFIPFLSLAPIFYPGQEPTWFKWVPVLAQNQMMNQLLKGEALNLSALAIAFMVCALITGLGLYYISHKIRRVVMV